MPALNYQSQFAPAVESGRKSQTIRAMRKRRFRAGDRLYHYTGMRTKACRKLRESDCIWALDIMIDGVCVVIDHGVPLMSAERDLLAIADGFKSYDELEEWFGRVHGFPFRGQLVKWKPGE